MQVDERLGINKDADAVEFINAISFARLSIEFDRIGKTRATATQYAKAQAALFWRDAFFGNCRADLLDRLFSDLNAGPLRRGRLRLRSRLIFSCPVFDIHEIRH